MPQVAASVVRQLITGLAVHDLPMLRDLAPVIERVVFARAVAPIGYVVGYRASGIPVRLATVMLPDGADALWELEITTDTDVVTVSFPPAFVHVGSAEVRVVSATGKRTTYPIDDTDGYLAEWRALADVLNGASVVEYDELLDDARYAITLADAASELIARCAMTDVQAPAGRYRTALAELPLSTRRVERPDGVDRRRARRRRLGRRGPRRRGCRSACRGRGTARASRPRRRSADCTTVPAFR